jgi:hypothetical protein
MPRIGRFLSIDPLAPAASLELTAGIFGKSGDRCGRVGQAWGRCTSIVDELRNDIIVQTIHLYEVWTFWGTFEMPVDLHWDDLQSCNQKALKHWTALGTVHFVFVHHKATLPKLKMRRKTIMTFCQAPSAR